MTQKRPGRPDEPGVDFGSSARPSAASHTSPKSIEAISFSGSFEHAGSRTANI